MGINRERFVTQAGISARQPPSNPHLRQRVGSFPEAPGILAVQGLCEGLRIFPDFHCRPNR
jgi:hypothetical protein